MDELRLRRRAMFDASFAVTLFGHDLAYGGFAFAAARRHSEFELEFVETARCPFGQRGANFPVGNRFAHTDYHDEVR